MKIFQHLFSISISKCSFWPLGRWRVWPVYGLGFKDSLLVIERVILISSVIQTSLMSDGWAWKISGFIEAIVLDLSSVLYRYLTGIGNRDDSASSRL